MSCLEIKFLQIKFLQVKASIVALAIAATASTLLVTAALAAATEDDFKTAYAAAEAANKQAGALRDQWTTTQTALDDAKKAAESGNFDQAVASAKEAEALAKASIYQATSEKDAWKALEIH
jgi:hypothetical protein